MDILRVNSERKAPEERLRSANPINPCTDNLRRSWCTGNVQPLSGSTGNDKHDFLFRSPSSSLAADPPPPIRNVWSPRSSVGVVLSLSGGVSTACSISMDGDGLRGSISACSGDESGSVSVIEIGATSGITGVRDLNDSLRVSFGVSIESGLYRGQSGE